MLLFQDVIDSFLITDSIIPTRAASKQPPTGSGTASLTDPSPQVNGVASSSERVRAASASGFQAVRPANRSAANGPSIVLEPSQAGPSEVKRPRSGLSKSSVSRSSSASSLRRAPQRTAVTKDSDDD